MAASRRKEDLNQKGLRHTYKFADLHDDGRKEDLNQKGLRPFEKTIYLGIP